MVSPTQATTPSRTICGGAPRVGQPSVAQVRRVEQPIAAEELVIPGQMEMTIYGLHFLGPSADKIGEAASREGARALHVPGGGFAGSPPLGFFLGSVGAYTLPAMDESFADEVVRPS